MTDAYYLPLGDGGYEPTLATESPWDSTAQHGGPPAALLAHAVGATVGDGMRLGRISVDFLGPIPRQPLTVRVTPLKPGRRVSLAEATMTVGARVVAVARTWHIATGPRPPAESERDVPPPLPPAGPAEHQWFRGLGRWGYGEATEWRFTLGGFDELGPADVWTRVRLPLVAGTPLSGQDRALVVADSANGLSATLPMGEWFSIPPTMTTTFVREPVGEWVHLRTRTHLAEDGLGLAHADLLDPTGFIGEVSQPLLVQQR